MKKRGIVDTMIKIGILAASIGGTLYLFKDKIEENPKCKDAMDKIKNKVKDLASNQEDTMDETDLFDEDFDEIIHASAPSKERGYVNIKLPSEQEEAADAEPEEEEISAPSEEAEEDTEEA